AEDALAAAQGATASRESVATLTRVIEEHPRYLAALQRLGQMLNDLRDHTAALSCLEKARALNPASARTLCEIRRAYYLLRKDAEARQALEKALEINPYFPTAWQYMLRMLQVVGAADGRQWAERARRANPANFALALLGVKLYPAKEAVGVLRELLDG